MFKTLFANSALLIKHFILYLSQFSFYYSHFHYAKAIYQRVVKAGLKSYYSRSKKETIKDKKKGKQFKPSKKGIAFSTFIRAAIGIAYVPLNKIDLAYDILEELALELRGKKIRKFGQEFLSYYRKTWLNGYDRASWNMHMHRGITSNNVSEGYNSKINSRKQVGFNPNPYL